MMPLHCTITLEELKSEPERFDFLHTSKLLDQIERIDELHATEDDDSEYFFIIWLKGGSMNDYGAQLQRHIDRFSNDPRNEGGWWFSAQDTGSGILLVRTWL